MFCARLLIYFHLTLHSTPHPHLTHATINTPLYPPLPYPTLPCREKEDYKNKMNHLQEAVRTHFSSLTSLKQQAAQYRKEKEGSGPLSLLFRRFLFASYL
jgi:superoxide dismutase